MDLSLQVLASTMYQTNFNSIEKMNLHSDAIIVNQCERNEIQEFEYNGYHIDFLSFHERGVGLSRNNALMRAKADICMFADEDIVYVDNYVQLVKNAFQKNKHADVIIFNVPSLNNNRPTANILKNRRCHIWNCLKFGAVNIAVRRAAVMKANIFFSILFGGGTLYSSGEDSLFLINCLKAGLKIYMSKEVIAHVRQEASSWFAGYTEKYFFDKGAFASCAFGLSSYLFCLQFAFRKHALFRTNITIIQACALMFTGISRFRHNDLRTSTKIYKVRI
jgi:Glycosyltransferases, probably involved in cell wall biogenesis